LRQWETCDRSESWNGSEWNGTDRSISITPRLPISVYSDTSCIGQRRASPLSSDRLPFPSTGPSQGLWKGPRTSSRRVLTGTRNRWLQQGWQRGLSCSREFAICPARSANACLLILGLCDSDTAFLEQDKFKRIALDCERSLMGVSPCVHRAESLSRHCAQHR